MFNDTITIPPRKKAFMRDVRAVLVPAQTLKDVVELVNKGRLPPPYNYDTATPSRWVWDWFKLKSFFIVHHARVDSKKTTTQGVK